MAIGWFVDLDAAEDYFNDERPEQSHWDEAEDETKTRALMAAYNRIYYNPNYDTPIYADATASELERLTRAQAEYAYYLLEHHSDEDSRKGLQAQAVTAAGVVKETYDSARAGELPIPPFVAALLNGFLNTPNVILGANLARDEDQSVDTKVHDF